MTRGDANRVELEDVPRPQPVVILAVIVAMIQIFVIGVLVVPLGLSEPLVSVFVVVFLPPLLTIIGGVWASRKVTPIGSPALPENVRVIRYRDAD